MWIYNLLIQCYALLIRISAFRNPKARQWVSGRKNWKNKLKLQLQACGNSKRFWMHCASYGEFEQGRPLLEAIRKQHPHYKIVLSFFSPSGYEAFKDWTGADVICYLPLDTKNNAKYFVSLVRAEKIIFVKYEFWLNFLNEIQNTQTPAFLVSAIFKPHHPFFRWYGSIFKASLKAFHTIFVQDQSSLTLLKSLGLSNAIIAGDTRFDRVVEIKTSFKPLPFFDAYCKHFQIIVAGSTWTKDQEFLLDAYLKIKHQNLKLIIVPHEVNKKNITELQSSLQEKKLPFSLYSEVHDKQRAENILVLDTIGLLSKLYHYATVAYVGGGFDSGIHNLLEPAVHLKPVIFCGLADYSKYNEALELIQLGAAIAVKEVNELSHQFSNLLESEKTKNQLEKNLTAYFNTRSGSAKKIMELVFG